MKPKRRIEDTSRGETDGGEGVRQHVSNEDMPSDTGSGSTHTATSATTNTTASISRHLEPSNHRHPLLPSSRQAQPICPHDDHPSQPVGSSSSSSVAASPLSSSASSATAASRLLQSVSRSILMEENRVLEHDSDSEEEEGELVATTTTLGSGTTAVITRRPLPSTDAATRTQNLEPLFPSDSPPASPTSMLQSLQQQRLPALPEEQDRKRFVGALAAVLAAAYDFDQVDEQWDNVQDMEEAIRSESLAYLNMTEHDPDSSFGNDDSDNDSIHNLYHVSCSFESFSSDNNDALSDLRQNPSSPQHSKSYRHAASASAISSGSRDRRGITRARNRHRRRRYAVLSKLLLSSAELLQLEKSQAKAFLPMLAKLLVPKTASETNRSSNRASNMSSMSSTNSHSRQSLQDDDYQIRMDDEKKTSTSFSNPATTTTIYSAAVHDFTELGEDRSAIQIQRQKKQEQEELLSEEMDRIEHLGPFLDSMTPGSGIRCLVLFLLQHLMHSPEGYDARIRHAVKTLGVLLLLRDMDSSGEFDDDEDIFESSHGDVKRSPRMVDRIERATRKFEALEHAIATRLMKLSEEQEKSMTRRQRTSGRAGPPKLNTSSRQASFGPSRDQILRGLKIGGTAVVAGTLFAVTGGLAAPGIAAGVAAVAGGTAATAAATAVLSSTAAVTAIFGVGGGGLAAYKMQRRTQGLTEFEFRKEGRSKSQHTVDGGVDLFSTIMLSGWLRDEYDFQRPWGVTPTSPRLKDKLELLERFYSVHSPDHVMKCKRILQSWEGEERELWKVLRQKYGTDPDHLFPLSDGPRFDGKLTLEQEEVVDQIFIELGYAESPILKPKRQPTPFERMKSAWRNSNNDDHQSSLQDTSLRGSYTARSGMGTSSLHGSAPVDQSAVDGAENTSNSGASEPKDDQKEKPLPSHLSTVWDYEANFGGELYTVKWESDLLLELCDSVADLAFDVIGGGTAQILKHTALSSLLTAIAWPYALVSAANMIDGTWTLAVERADEAGKELARSLLFSRAGHRPVTLVGYSFGARAIYSCLKELAKYQEKWEDYHEGSGGNSSRRWGSSKEEEEEMFKYMREPASIVEDAVLMGLPNHLSLTSWKACRQIVAGRLVNCFSQNDLILSLMFQFKRLGLKPVCGTCPVDVHGVENIDLSDLISRHQDYCLFTGEILRRIRHCQPFQIRPNKVIEARLGGESHETNIDIK